jgi:acetyl-CoA synthetase
MLSRFLPRETFESYDDFKRDFSIRVPERFNFAYDVVDARAAETPDRTAMVWCDDRGGVRTITFAEMKRQSDRAANFFTARGIGKGDPVMLILKRRYEFWFCLLGLHKIGAVAIPATHLLRAKDIIYRNRAADIRMIVAVPDTAIVEQVEEAESQSPSLRAKAILGGPRPGWIDFDAALAEAPDAFAPPSGDAAPANDDALLIYFTSGTTGMPKMVRHDFAYPLGHIITSRYWQNVRDGGLHLTVADTGWAKAVWGKIYGQWLAGAAVFVYDYDKFVPKELLAVISRHRVTSFCAPPTIFRYLIKEALASFDLSALEYCTVAGEPLNPEVYNQWLQATGIRLMEGYGQTETVVQIATWPWMEPRPGSMGKPAPGYDIDVVDEEGASCEAGAEGQIIIRTGTIRPPGMFQGYYRDPELTARVWHDGVYYTGDMAWRDEDGYFWFVGRADDVIKSSGYRIGPFEVESALLEHPAVLECAITAVPDPDRGQVVKATVVLTAGYQPGPELVKILQEHVKTVTAPYKYPRVIEFVSELPKTISGKIRRIEIRDRDQDV